MMYSYVEQNRLKNVTLKERLEPLGGFLKEEGIDAWLILAKEYNEDIVFPMLTPAYYPTARRITMLYITHEDGVTKPYSLSLPDEELEQFYTPVYDYKNEDQWDALKKIIEKTNPNKIAINYSENWAFADGLSTGLYMTLMKKMPKEISDRFVSSEPIAIRYLETRTPTEIEIYPHVCSVAHAIIDEAFSDAVVKPGKTTCRDVMDFMDTKTNSFGITNWFPSHVDLQRPGAEGRLGENTVIQKGDLLHCDFGITYIGLCTDAQRLCYVLKDDETSLPEGLKVAKKRNDRFQDIVRGEMKIGRTGNEAFISSIEKGKAEGLEPILYNHPLGKHGHAAGPLMGLYTKQEPVPVRGDAVIHNNTSYALELTTMEYVPEFGAKIHIQTEESVMLIDDEVSFMAPGRDIIKVIKGGF